MAQLTDSELQQLLAELESDRVERKETFGGGARESVREAVCAFANDLPDHRLPGVVFIGARDADGAPSGQPITDELLRELAAIKTDGNIVPPPSMTVQKRVLGGAEYAVVVVEPSDAPPVRYRGQTMVRVGPRRGIATRQDERILNEKRRGGDLPFDSTPVRGATIADLDRVLFEHRYLPRAVSAEALEANDRTYEERLASLKMIAAVDAPVPTVAGLLVLGPRNRDWLPGAYVQFLKVDGPELSDPIVDAAEYDGTILDVERRLMEKLQAHNHVAVDFTSGPHETRSWYLAPAALEQLSRNALLHRTYEGTHAPIKVVWFSDRVEITSPGGPYGLINEANFGQPGRVDYRNPVLAEAMKVLGLVQRFGFGIPVARAASREAGLREPEFRVDSSFVTWTLWGRSS